MLLLLLLAAAVCLSLHHMFEVPADPNVSPLFQNVVDFTCSRVAFCVCVWIHIPSCEVFAWVAFCVYVHVHA
jgi:hypothetical protein